MKAVVDTNVFISALIKPQSTVGPVLTHLRQGNYNLLSSDELLEELLTKLALPRIRDKYHLGDADIQTVLALVLRRGEFITPHHRIQVCRDPKDDIMLEIALTGRVDYIVTGDKDLLVLHPFEGIPIIKPIEFLKELETITPERPSP